MSDTATFEKGAYAGKLEQEIMNDLTKQGYQPQLITEKANTSLDTHRHDESHILVQISGEMVVTSGPESFTMQPGDKLTIPPQVEHAADFGPEGSQYLWVEF